MANTDVFLCYRRRGAQTAKLFKRYLVEKSFPGAVWYSDAEVLGNYRNDIDELVNDAECAIIFIDPDFTTGFLEENNTVECITALEILAIAQKLYIDPTFNVLTVYLDRPTGFTPDEIAILETLCTKHKCAEPIEIVRNLTQRNMVPFATATDNEDELFYDLSQRMLPDSFYQTQKALGNFHFGRVHTQADVVVWDEKIGILPENIIFELTSETPGIYRRVQRSRASVEHEIQNNTMLSFVEQDVVLEADSEEKILTIRYNKVDYRTYSKALELWEQLEFNKLISSYDWRSDTYPIPNAMGLALMVLTADQSFVFTRRSPRRKIRPHEYDCSIVEGLRLEELEGYHIDDEDYIRNEIVRAFREEVCSDSTDLIVEVNGLVLDRQYGQWNLVGTLTTPLTSKEIEAWHCVREDTFEDNEMFYVSYVDDNGELTTNALSSQIGKMLRTDSWAMAYTAVYAGMRKAGFTNEQIEQTVEAAQTSHY